MGEPREIYLLPSDSPCKPALNQTLGGLGTPVRGAEPGDFVKLNAERGVARAFLCDVSSEACGERMRNALKAHGPPLPSVILLGRDAWTLCDELGAHAAVDPDGHPKALERAVSTLLRLLQLRSARDRYEREAFTRRGNLRQLTRIGNSLSDVTQLDELIRLLLDETRSMLMADAVSLYLVREVDGEKKLVFVEALNESIELEVKQYTLTIDNTSIAGFCALTGRTINLRDAYNHRPTEFHFYKNFDTMTGYRTRSVLAAPLVNRDREVIGVLSAFNRKRERGALLLTEADVLKYVVPFDFASQELVECIASQAAVSIEYSRLYNDIKRLFDGFVEASVTAIEARDPTTGGHSERVARLSVGLAEKISDSGTDDFKDIAFSDSDITQLRYAAILHDFGKVGVKERILVKPCKLFDEDLARIQARFEYARERIVRADRERRIELLMQRPDDEALRRGLAAFDAELESQLQQLAGLRETVERANRPGRGQEELVERLQEATELYVPAPFGREEAIQMLTPSEFGNLSIRRGSLNDQERREIESHVSHTYDFLKRIPWTSELSEVPKIAYAHHEKLDGSGYPRGIVREEIPYPSRIMTVADIFDALTASDRPYKKAIPTDRAIDILYDEAERGKIERCIVDVLVETRVYEPILREARAGVL